MWWALIDREYPRVRNRRPPRVKNCQNPEREIRRATVILQMQPTKLPVIRRFAQTAVNCQLIISVWLRESLFQPMPGLPLLGIRDRRSLKHVGTHDRFRCAPAGHSAAATASIAVSSSVNS